MRVVFTIGHSTHPPDRFIALLDEFRIDAVYDVRSAPYSRMSPQFNREDLRKSLAEAGISYLFLGRELGARSEDRSCYEDGKVQYERIAHTELFRGGIDRVAEGIGKGLRIALMCTEKEPIECHRMILLARHMESRGVEVRHIHADGRMEPNSEAVLRLAHKLRLPVDEMDMFRSLDDVLADAYRLQERRIAYAAPQAAHA